MTAPNKSDFLKGLQAGISIALGYMPAAMTFGLLAKGNAGLSLIETVGMSLFVFTGAGQYIALNLIAVQATAFEIIFTTFMVNIRHLLMGAYLSNKVEPAPAWKKAIYSFGITDETFAMSSAQKGALSTSFMYGLVLMSYSSWVINSGVGYVAGALMPVALQESMGVALYAMFVGLLVPSLKKSRKVVSLALIAAILNSVLITFLSIGWSIILSSLIASIIVEAVVPREASQQ